MRGIWLPAFLLAGMGLYSGPVLPDSSDVTTLKGLAEQLSHDGLDLVFPETLRDYPTISDGGLHRRLAGYNYVVTPEKVIVTGLNGDGGDSPVSGAADYSRTDVDNTGANVIPEEDLPRMVRGLPNPLAMHPFPLGFDDVVHLAPGDRIDIPLPEGTVQGTVFRTGTGGLGGHILIAMLPEKGQARLVYGRDGSVYGRVFTGHSMYRIVGEKGHKTVIYDPEQAGLKLTMRHDHLLPGASRKNGFAWSDNGDGPVMAFARGPGAKGQSKEVEKRNENRGDKTKIRAGLSVPGSVSAGESFQVNWTSVNATSCDLRGGADGWAEINAPPEGSKTITLNGKTSKVTFQVVCCNGGRSSKVVHRTVKVRPPIPQVALQGPDQVVAGQPFTLAWQSSYAKRCELEGGENGWSQRKAPLSGQKLQVLSDVGQRVRYAVRCKGKGGTIEVNHWVTVISNDDNTGQDQQQDQQNGANPDSGLVVPADRNRIKTEDAFLTEWKRNAMVVDVLLIREPEVTDAFIDYEIMDTNQMFIDSKMMARLRVVGVVTRALTRPDGPKTESEALDKCIEENGGEFPEDGCPIPDEVMDATGDLYPLTRYAVIPNGIGADIFGAIVYDHQDYSNYVCGYAYMGLVNRPQDLIDPPMHSVFFAVLASQNCWEATIAHEVGHVMGLEHDVDSSTLPNEYLYRPYAHGYFNGIAGTIMSYEYNLNYVPEVFSNPDLDCFGAPCGDPETANAAAVLNETVKIVAGFRETIKPEQEPDLSRYRRSAVVNHADDYLQPAVDDVLPFNGAH